MAYKQPSSGLPFKEIGSSPAKQTEEKPQASPNYVPPKAGSQEAKAKHRRDMQTRGRQAFSKGAHEVAMEHGAENLGKPRDKRDLRKVSKKKPGKLAVKDSMKKVGKRMMKKEMKKIPKKGETWPKVRRITDSEGKLIK